jgi:hypothetical protein
MTKRRRDVSVVGARRGIGVREVVCEGVGCRMRRWKSVLLRIRRLCRQTPLIHVVEVILRSVSWLDPMMEFVMP